LNDAVGTFLGSWSLDAFVLVNLVLTSGWYLWAARRAAVHWPVSSTACFLAGIALLATAYLGPLPTWSHTFFWAHMTQHLLVMMAAAPLLVLGNPVTLAFAASSDATRRQLIVPVLRSRAMRILTNPYLTWLLFASVLLGAHFSPFYNWALENHDVDSSIEQPLFLVAALLYFFPLIGSNLQPRRPTHAFRLVSLALMMVPEAITGAVIYFSSVVLYASFDRPRPIGLEPLPDQQLAGGLMWALVMVVDSFWMMVAAAQWYADEERKGRRLDAELAGSAT
jgi:cytochrome c oxidase assembly factor CtaG